MQQITVDMLPLDQLYQFAEERYIMRTSQDDKSNIYEGNELGLDCIWNGKLITSIHASGNDEITIFDPETGLTATFKIQIPLTKADNELLNNVVNSQKQI